MKAMQKMILSSFIVVLVVAAASDQVLAQSSQKRSESDQSLVKNQPLVAFNVEGVSIASTEPRTDTAEIDLQKSFSFAVPTASGSLKPVEAKGWDQLSANEKKAFSQQLGGPVTWSVRETVQTTDSSKTKPFVFVNRGPKPLQ
jgi:hypothetical protein